MLAFAVRRLLAGAATLFAIAALAFLFTRIAPGSPFTSERTLHPEIIANFERFYGLDQPLHVQFGRALRGYLSLDLGPSMYYRDQTCNDIVWPGFRTSLALGSFAALLAFALGVPLGVAAAGRRNRLPDYAAMSFSSAGICIPNFLLGPLLILVFGSWLGLLPTGSWVADWGDPAEWTKLVLPVATLAMVHVAYLARLSRAGMLDVLDLDFIRTARAKGLSESAVRLRHALKNGITPAISYAGPMVAHVLTGSIVVEKIFTVPGLGQHFVNSALNRDMNLIMACVLVYSAMVILLNLGVDLLYGVLDPRVRMAA